MAKRAIATGGQSGGGGDAKGAPWRRLGWGLAAALLLAPLVAMQFTDEVNWDATDFLVFGAMLAIAGGGFELATRASAHRAYRAAAGIALVAAFLMFWANAAVGIIGSEDHPANAMFHGVIAVAFVGALVARLRPRGRALAMVATALAQALAAVVAWLAGWGQVWVFTGIFVAAWLAAAVLFRSAARASPAIAAAT